MLFTMHSNAYMSGHVSLISYFVQRGSTICLAGCGRTEILMVGCGENTSVGVGFAHFDTLSVGCHKIESRMWNE